MPPSFFESHWTHIYVLHHCSPVATPQIPRRSASFCRDLHRGCHYLLELGLFRILILLGLLGLPVQCLGGELDRDNWRQGTVA